LSFLKEFSFGGNFSGYLLWHKYFPKDHKLNENEENRNGKKAIEKGHEIEIPIFFFSLV
jgi:hypothetical protein